MVRRQPRSQKAVLDRCRLLRSEVRAALERLPESQDDVDTIDSIWRGEALGSLLWALGRVEMPPYDRPFETEAVLATKTAQATLRPPAELEAERETARLWLWRARTARLQVAGELALQQYASYDQLVASTAMRAYHQGILPAPLRGDFRAYGKSYRHLTGAQQAQAESLAAERHHALSWVCGIGPTWDDVPLDT